MQRGGQLSLCWGNGEPWKAQERGRHGFLAKISLGMAVCWVEWSRLGGPSECKGALGVDGLGWLQGAWRQEG